MVVLDVGNRQVFIQVLVQVFVGTRRYPGECGYLPRIQVLVPRVGSSVPRLCAQMMGMDFWLQVPVVADTDVSGYAIVKNSILNHLNCLPYTVCQI